MHCPALIGLGVDVLGGVTANKHSDNVAVAITRRGGAEGGHSQHPHEYDIHSELFPAGRESRVLGTRQVISLCRFAHVHARVHLYTT